MVYFADIDYNKSSITPHESVEDFNPTDDDEDNCSINSSKDEFIAEQIDSSTVWHGRLGHINKKYLAKNAKSTSGMPEIKINKDADNLYEKIDCICCCRGKLPKTHIHNGIIYNTPWTIQPITV